MILSDKDIILAIADEQIGIDPFDTNFLQPASYDLHLGWTFKTLLYNSPSYLGRMINPKLPSRYSEVDIRNVNRQEFSLRPGEVVLGTTIERFRFSANFVGRLEGKSSLARLGLLVHSTAGFFDPGFEGEATLELINCSKWPIILYPEMKIAQMSFHKLSSPAARPYGHPGLGSKYMDQAGPTESQMHLNWSNHD